jgi:large subunit ribosomal protein L10Ae
MARIHQETLHKAINELLQASKTKKRGFLETIELQIKLRGYVINKDKRFVGSIKLPHVIRPNVKIGVLGNKVHCEEAEALGIPAYDLATLQSFNKEKKTVKKWTRRHHLFIASSDVINQVNRVLGQTYTKANKFPTNIKDSTVEAIVDEVKKTANVRLKKSVAFGLPVANVSMTERQVYENIMLCTNFIVTLLKKGWQSVGSICIKSTMGHSHRVY